MVLFGVDVHETWQAGLNIERLAAEGYSYVVVKATQGAGGFTAGPTFEDWIRRTRAAGMIPGAYHWIDSSDPVRQADRFIERLTPVGGVEGLLLQIDCEDTSNPATPSILTAFVKQMIRRVGPHPLLLYTGSWWWQPHMAGFNAAALNLKLWHSSYVAGSGAVGSLAALIGRTMWTPGYGGWPEATILQFSDKGTAGGLTAGVDLNAFRGSRPDLLALTTSTPPQGDPMAQFTDAQFANLLAAVDVIGALRDGRDATWDNKPILFARTLSARLSALEGAAQDAKVRDTAEATEVAGLKAALTAVTAALQAGSTGTPLDTTAVIKAVQAEAAAVRDLVERHHADEMAELKHQHNAEIAGLLAEIQALQDTTQPTG